MPQQESKRIVRVKYAYTMPPSVAEETGIQEIAIVALTSEEELMAIRRADGQGARLAFELSKQALVEVNGKPVSTADETVDRAWEQLGSVGRRLLTDASSELSVPKESDVSAFRKSRRVVAG